MNDDRRAALEGIVFGNDPGITPADRLRALELRQTETTWRASRVYFQPFSRSSGEAPYRLDGQVGMPPAGIEPAHAV